MATNRISTRFRRQARIEQLGRELLARARAAQPTIFSPAWWRQQGMEQGIRNPEAQTRLFRFIEVLPALRTAEQVADHLKQFLGDPALELPAILRLMLSYRSPRSPLAMLAAAGARLGAPIMAAGFVCGTNAAEAIRSVLRMRRNRMAFTVDILGEACTSPAVAEEYVRRYIALIEDFVPAVQRLPAVEQIDEGPNGPLPRVNVSIKLSALCSRFDPVRPERTIGLLKERVRPILRRARELGAFINFDMEQAAYVDITTDVFKSLLSEPEFGDWPDVGTVVQAYLVRSEDLATDLIQWCRRRGTPITIRLVKGAYWDSEVAHAVRERRSIPVWTNKWESDACFERIAFQLLTHAEWIHTALASHNVRSLAAGMAAALELGLDPRACEIQMLAGMGDPLKHAVVQMGRRLRVYAPFGDLVPGMAYLIRRLLENTSNDSFLRQSFVEGRDEDELLASPEDGGLHADVRQPPDTGRALVSPDLEVHMPSFENSPDTDFADRSNRERMAEALTSVRDQFGREYPARIGGDAVATGEWFASVNPSAPSEIVGRVCRCGPAEVDRAVGRARAALVRWAGHDIAERVALVRRVGRVLQERRFELAAWVCLESGMGWLAADREVGQAVDLCGDSAGQMEQLGTHAAVSTLPGEQNAQEYTARGVVAVWGSCRAPLASLVAPMSAALVAGDPVVVYPAPQTAVVAAKLAELFEEAGLPDGVLHFCPGASRDTGLAMVRHPDVAVVSFSGTTRLGVQVCAEAGTVHPRQRQLKQMLACLGGNHAIIVDLDAELGEAADGVRASAFAFAGQHPAKITRAIILDDVYDSFVHRISESAASLTVGPADDPASDVGPLIDADQRQTVQQLIETARSEFRLVFEASLPDPRGSDGYFVAPTGFADVDPSSWLAQDEVPGPVLALIRARDFGNALEIANSTRFAGVGGVYSRSPRNIERARREFEVGNLFINRPTVDIRVGRQPFGGFRMSGTGHQIGGADFILRFVQARAITENTMRHGMAPDLFPAGAPQMVH